MAILTPDISIHSLRMEGDAGYNLALEMTTEFQSTPSAWRETVFWETFAHFGFISIHSLRMEGDITIFCCQKESKISIHSLRMEGDNWKIRS